MTDHELQRLRREKWHLDGNRVLTVEQATDFLESVGFCLMLPQKPMPLVPTFIGAYLGSDENLPTQQMAFSDDRAREATEIMIRLLRHRGAYESNHFGENSFLIAPSVFPYFYALVGERSPRQTPKLGVRSEYSPLARDTFEVIRQHGPVSKQRLIEVLGGGVSGRALDHALRELWSKLRITRVDYDPRVGASWDALYRWSAEGVRAGINLSVGEALSALISKYLDCVIAAEPQELVVFLSNFVSRSRVNEALNALLAARELTFVHVAHKSLVQVAPELPPPRRVRAGKSA